MHRQESREAKPNPNPTTESLLAGGFRRPAVREPIAITGIGCRFPGTDGPEAFWQLMKDGLEVIKEVPSDRFEIDEFYDEKPGTPGKIASRLGGFLDQIDQFDASFFRISPREALRMDPQQRLLLEVAWEAVEDAGLSLEKLAGSSTGVFIGACASDYEDIQYHLRDRSEIDLYSSTGTARSILSGRISYFFDLRGPSLTIDTACSSSLIAVHLACQSLWSGECETAFAGGVNLVILPEISMSFSRAKMLAPDGRCKFGDASANGFRRSDGVGVVILKPLWLARQDRDPVYAIIRGTAVNNDGSSSGLLATPSRHGQESVVRQAYKNAGVLPGRAQYVEVHGTGTSVGDPIEVQSLGAVLAEGRPEGSRCLIGSVKTNIGHTEGAAGIAALIKVALCLKHKAIPPSLHFNMPNPNIAWNELSLEVPRELTDWPRGEEPAIAGVSSLGISATNAHVVLEEAPKENLPDYSDESNDTVYLLPLSAHSSESLTEKARSYESLLAGGDPYLKALCYTASVRRTHHDHRMAVIIRSHREGAEKLESLLNGRVAPGISLGQKAHTHLRKLVFVFPGQGSQWLGMGRELLRREPAFRSALELCDQAVKKHVNWSVLEELTCDESLSRLDRIDVIQPSIFAIQVALSALWRSWGIEPDAVVGQSMGEIAAAHVAGVLSLEDAAKIICRRSLILKRASGRGGMLVAGLALDDALKALHGLEDRVSVAVSSSPISTVLSGDSSALKEIMDTLTDRGVYSQFIKVDVASHSPQMDPLRDELLAALEGIDPMVPSIPIFSTVTGGKDTGSLFDADYWVRNLREPVLFSSTIEKLSESGHDMFLEISPHPVVLSPIQQIFKHLGRDCVALPSLRCQEQERAVMLGSLGALYASGYRVNWDLLYPDGGQVVRLPAYPWRRQRFWPVEQGAIATSSRREAASPRRSDSTPWFSGAAVRSAAHHETYFWEVDLSTALFPYLEDHRLQEAVVLPAAAYIDMALTAATGLFGNRPRLLEDLRFKKALFLSHDRIQRLQLVISRERPDKASIRFYSTQTGELPLPWMLNATGSIVLDHSGLQPAQGCSPELILSTFSEVISQSDHYTSLAGLGFQYGPCFQGVERVWKRAGEAIARITLPERIRSESSAHHIHPALLDSCLQALAAILIGEDFEAYLPVGLDSLLIDGDPADGLWSHALLHQEEIEGGDTLRGDVSVLDESGRVILQANGLRMKRLVGDDDPVAAQKMDDWFYEIAWHSSPLFRHQRDAGNGSWVLFMDRKGVGDMLVANLEACGERCIRVYDGETYRAAEQGSYFINPACPQDYLRLFADIFSDSQQPLRGVVHLWSLDETPLIPVAEFLEATRRLGWGSGLYLVQALASASMTPPARLWLVTAGTQPARGRFESISIAQSPMWGLGKVIAQEHPEFHCTMIDLGSELVSEDVRSLFFELMAGEAETQIALRGETRFVARLVCNPELETQAIIQEKQRYSVADDQTFRLETSSPGILDSLTLRATSLRSPGPGEVEIQVCAAGLNFRDVLLALGMLPSAHGAQEGLGWDCSGRISAVGEGVEGFKIGDEVLAIATPCFGSRVIADASLVLHKSPDLSFEEAASMPIAFLTAYYALKELARLRAGERVLIHAATGGVGLAAVRLAQQSGAEVFATASTTEKARYLESLGVKHIFDSRSLSFADEVMKAAGGGGVDVVLNSLAGEAITAGLSILKMGGRFLELGRRDIYQDAQLNLSPFKNNLSFFAIDIALLTQEQPSYMGYLLKEAVEFFGRSGESPLPLKVFPLQEVEKAFQFMAQARHIGKIVVAMEGQEAETAPPSRDLMSIRSDGTYMITGGLGGLGLSVAEWMVGQGARNIVLIGRSDPSPASQQSIDRLKKLAGLRVIKADVSRPEMADVIAKIERSMPPLRGIVHAAGVLDDKILLQMDAERFAKVMAPKVTGALNLHNLTLGAPLDFFVLFSSAASLIGSAGQANYSAANAFMDALAHYRRSVALPALSINWGRWSEVGLAATPGRRSRLAQRGFRSITPEEGLKALGRLLLHDAAQVAVMPFDFEQWGKFYPNYRDLPLFDNIRVSRVSDSPSHKASEEGRLTPEILSETDQHERKHVMESYLGRQLARVLGLGESSRVNLETDQPISRFGIDSLMAVELRTRIEADLGYVVSIVNLLGGSSLAQLAAEILEALAVPLADQGEDSEQMAGFLASVGPTPDHWEDLIL